MPYKQPDSSELDHQKALTHEPWADSEAAASRPGSQELTRALTGLQRLPTRGASADLARTLRPSSSAPSGGAQPGTGAARPLARSCSPACVPSSLTPGFLLSKAGHP